MHAFLSFYMGFLRIFKLCYVQVLGNIIFVVSLMYNLDQKCLLSQELSTH